MRPVCSVLPHTIYTPINKVHYVMVAYHKHPPTARQQCRTCRSDATVYDQGALQPRQIVYLFVGSCCCSIMLSIVISPRILNIKNIKFTYNF